MGNKKLTLFVNENEPPLASLITTQIVTDISVNIQWCNETYISVEGNKLDTDASACRYIARQCPALQLYGSSILDSVEVDQWISFAIGQLEHGSFVEELANLDKGLSAVTYLVGHSITIADILLWSVLHRNSKWKGISKDKSKYVNVSRWYSFIEAQESVQEVLKIVANRAAEKKKNVSREKQLSKAPQRKAEGKFIQLPGAEQGKVVVRFPPEASGYLHIGHAKAVLLNQYYRDTYEGKLIMRFDDTNPAKEKVDFEKVILEDLRLLNVTWDIFSHTSDYFDSMLQYCEQLLKSGDAYVDDTEAETMKLEREQKVESKNRNNTVERNLSMWQEMKLGSESGQRCCVRAKIDMNSPNGCLRDPTIYRCKNEPHPRTNTKYKVYPTYDFACPIVDSLEGVTHCLRTTEYHDRDEQFIWFIRKLGLREPAIWDYSRLNMTHTVLSKRKLTWFIEEGLVDGWDDPRLPTVRGIIRRGLTVDGLKEFIIAQGGSRSVVVMHWDKIWAINKKIIDPIAPRYTAVDKIDTVQVNVKDAKEHTDKIKLHPKNDDLGDKIIYRAPSIIIDQADAQLMKEGDKVTFVSWGNMKITKIKRNGNCVSSIDVALCLSDTNYKDTLKVTWLSNAVSSYPLIPVVCVYFDHIITKAVLGKDEDFKTYVNKNTKTEVSMLAEPELRNAKKGDIVQLQRKGFFVCDRPYEPYSVHSCRQTPAILFYIPDGHTKEVLPSSVAKNENVCRSDNNDAADIAKELIETTTNKSKVVKSEEYIKKNKVGSDEEEHVLDVLSQIAELGGLVRSLKAAKADKSVVMEEVNKLLALKSDYKTITGEEWKANIPAAVGTKNSSAATEKSSIIDNDGKVTVVLNAIAAQGSHIRSLKAAKADKSVITEEVKKLLALKAEYKTLTGQEWTPDVKVDSSSSSSSGSSQCVVNVAAAEKSSDKISSGKALLLNEIATRGNRVRSLKAANAEKSIVMEELQRLIALKRQYKIVTGEDWTPDTQQSALDKTEPMIAVGKSSVETAVSNDKVATLLNAIAAQGDRVRSLKAAKSDKSIVNEEVIKLLALKAEYKTLTGEDWTPNSTVVVSSTNKNPSQPTSTVVVDDKLSADDKTAAAVNDGVTTLLIAIAAQGDRVRSLKAAKSDKSIVNEEVIKLLALKAEYKTLTGEDWTPNSTAVVSSTNKKNSSSTVVDDKLSADDKTAVNDGNRVTTTLLNAIAAQGDRVRSLKAAKSDKSVVNEEVIKLLALKAEYKTLTGEDWTPNSTAVVGSTNKNSSSTVVVDDKLSADDKTAAVNDGNRVTTLLNAIAAQGDRVRSLKAAKSDKSVVNEEVQKLLALKAEYKALTGDEWKPNICGSVKTTQQKQEPQTVAEKDAAGLVDDEKVTALLNAIAAQGNMVRNLKADKADTLVVGEEVKRLLALKAEYKTLTGQEWKPLSETNKNSKQQTIKDEKKTSSSETNNKSKDSKRAVVVEKKQQHVSPPNQQDLLTDDASGGYSEFMTAVMLNTFSPDVVRLLDSIHRQSNSLSNLRSSEAPSNLVDKETKVLFALKDDYKQLTGDMWSPDINLMANDDNINKQTVPIATKSDDVVVATSVQKTVATKAVTTSSSSSSCRSREKKTVSQPKQQQQQQSDVSQGSVKKQTRLGLEAKKEENLPEWYSQVITKGELIEYYDVSGCYILRPWAYAIWEMIQSWFDAEIKKLGVQNCYFPIFVSKSVLEREKTHIADFAPEVAWVTKSGETDLAEPIAIRPTSETVMYPAYAKWIQSHRDLPIKLNQWNNVVRWEFKHPQPFLRTREFLWQEGHTAYATKKEAVEEVYTILDLYAKIYTDLLAIPVVKGRKTEKEKFAGGDFTTTVEAFVAASGRGIQGATSHHLGQNFSKMFNIVFEDPETKEKAFVYQNSWGITTRTIGVMIMIHSDNQGLVLPPRIATVQVVIVPCGIGVNTTDAEKKSIYDSCGELEQSLKSVGVRVKGDYRDNYSPGWKFNHWELKGVPVRIELGPKDIKENRFVAVRRDLGAKITVSRENALQEIKNILDQIHEYLYRKAENDLQSHIITCHEWSQFTPALDKKNLILAPFCCESSCEDNIKRDSTRDESLEPGAPSMGAKTLCIPFEQPIDDLEDSTRCIYYGCRNLAKSYVLFGRSY